MWLVGGEEYVHLRVEEARVGFDNCYGAIVGLESSEFGALRDNGSQIQAKLLWMHIRLELVGQTLPLAGWYFNGILLRCQVANDARARWVEVRCPQTSSHKLHSHWLRFFVAEGEDRVCDLAIDKLDSEDLGVREIGRYRYS